MRNTNSELKQRVLRSVTASLMQAVLVVIAAVALFAPAAQAQGCPASEKNVRCKSVVTPCEAGPGVKFSACSGGVVTPMSLGSIAIFHNSQKPQAGVSLEGVGRGWTLLERIEETSEALVLRSANGDTTIYHLKEASYLSEDRPRGDLSTITKPPTGGYLVSTLDGASVEFTKEFFGAFYPETYLDPLGNRTVLTYGDATVPVPILITSPGSPPITLTVVNNLLERVTVRGIAHVLGYDSSGRLINVILPDGKIIRFTYDTSGLDLITNVTDPFGRSKVIKYDKQPAGHAVARELQDHDAKKYYGSSRI